MLQWNCDFMSVNRNKPDMWKVDIKKSVDLYNSWFVEFAPSEFRKERNKAKREVDRVFKITDNLSNISSDKLRENPSIVSTLRMTTCPPLARDRLIGLASLKSNLIKVMESDNKLPIKMKDEELNNELDKLSRIINEMLDFDLFNWLTDENSDNENITRASLVIADRLCGSIVNPIIRNAQEKRQLEKIAIYLNDMGYKYNNTKSNFQDMDLGTYRFHMNVPVFQGAAKKNVSVDVIVKHKKKSNRELPLLIEAKSAGDFTNVNKRRKEEAKKMQQLRDAYGDDIQYILFLCGYFDTGYLGYEAAEKIDWVWEHRISDLDKFGIVR